MEKNKIKTLLFALVILASIASYAYLNSEKVKCFVNYNEAKVENQTQLEEDLHLPDMRLVVKFFENAKKFLPASNL